MMKSSMTRGCADTQLGKRGITKNSMGILTVLYKGEVWYFIQHNTGGHIQEGFPEEEVMGPAGGGCCLEEVSKNKSKERGI